jgi:uncharacterized RDD family membrane protein YckC
MSALPFSSIVFTPVAVLLALVSVASLIGFIIGPSQTRRFQPHGTARRQDLKDLPLASFARRLFAFEIDLVFVLILVAAASLPQVLVEGAKNQHYELELNPFHGWALLSLPLYFGLGTYLGKGRTVGKKLMRIRVLSLAHDHLTLWHSIERSLGYAASTLEGGFGFLQYFIHPNCQTVHDRIAETIVISESVAEIQTNRSPARTPGTVVPGGDATQPGAAGR